MTMPLTGSVSSYPRLVHPVSTLTVSPASEFTSGSQVRRMNPPGLGFGGLGGDWQYAGRQCVGSPADDGSAFPPERPRFRQVSRREGYWDQYARAAVLRD